MRWRDQPGHAAWMSIARHRVTLPNESVTDEHLAMCALRKRDSLPAVRAVVWTDGSCNAKGMHRVDQLAHPEAFAYAESA
jgi:hypothetical protein